MFLLKSLSLEAFGMKRGGKMSLNIDINVTNLIKISNLILNEALSSVIIMVGAYQPLHIAVDFQKK